MKSLTTVILGLTFFGSVFSHAHAAQCEHDNTVFFAYNMHHTKAVTLCKVNEGYTYTFGPVGKPELELRLRDVDMSGGMAGGFTIPNGKYNYTVMEDKFGNALLDVSTDTKQLAEIELDSSDNSYINNTLNYH